MCANWIFCWMAICLLIGSHGIQWTMMVRCWQRVRSNRHLSISEQRINALSVEQQQQQQQQNKWLKFCDWHKYWHYTHTHSTFAMQKQHTHIRYEHPCPRVHGHMWMCLRVHALIQQWSERTENSIISVKYIGNCLLNYACMTEPFDGTVGACMNRVRECMHSVYIFGAFWIS